jgi:hypothetical protein
MILAASLLIELSIAQVPSRWWEGDPTKEVASIKKALAEAEPPLTVTGYEDTKALIKELIVALPKYQRGGKVEDFVRVSALVYRGRNAIGIEENATFKAAKTSVLIQLPFKYAVDSYSHIRICTLLMYHYGYDGLMPPWTFVASLQKRAKVEDHLLDECLLRHMTYHLKDFRDAEVILLARKVAKEPRGKVTKAKIAGFALNNLARGKRDNILMEESLGLLKRYRAGMQVAEPREKTSMDKFIEMETKRMKAW